MQRLRRRFPVTDFMKNKHADCANFENGHCKFYHITVNPKGSACPHFKAKNKKEGTKTNDIDKAN
jgi:hypothetical protein